MDLSAALLQLEQAAAVVESFLPDDLSEADLLELSAAWGPPPRAGGPKLRLADARCWLSWIRSCAGRHEQRPDEISADDLHRVIVRWVCASDENPA